MSDDLPRQLFPTVGIIRPEQACRLNPFPKVSGFGPYPPDFGRLSAVDAFAIIVTAPGAADDVDFVSRFFAPWAGIPEDPVTGSAHCTLTPYWSEQLGKKSLRALQVSSRGGELWCEDRGERVSIAGRAVEYLRGEIHVPDPS